jgi:tRNA A-37 threonylcarbamoyl transferase component Bud32
MNEIYTGRLSEGEPLYAYLSEEILGGVLGFRHVRPVFDIYRLDVSSTIFRYSDRRSFVELVCKSYGNKWIKGSQTGEPALRAAMMRREFENLLRVRALGLDSQPHRAVRPLGTSEPLNCLLVEDYAPGLDLDFYIRAARDHAQTEQLSSRLTDVAWFLADLHNRSQTRLPVVAEQSFDYFDRILSELIRWDIISIEQRRRLEERRTLWEQSALLAEGVRVLVHGDANPTNFLWNGERNLTVIDFEALKEGDRAFDLGCMAAELKHLFWWYTHDAWASEPFIQHFYASYRSYMPDTAEDFESLMERARFMMACVMLRIARNSWLDINYRQQLIEDAIRCLNI